MSLDRFVAERSADWSALEQLTKRAGTRPERLDAATLLRLGGLYRSAAADLALARRRYPDDPTTRRLEALVLRARQAVYADRPRRLTLRGFLVDGYWRRVAERPPLLGLAVLLMLAPLAATLGWAIDDPAAAVGIVPDRFQSAAEPGDRSGLTHESAGARSAFASEIFTNNIQVSFTAFAGGILLGLGTAASLIYNGAFIGALTGLVIEAGDVDEFFRLIVPHGVLELSVICVAGYAGLRLARAIIVPGTRTRVGSLQAEARPAAELVLGTIPWFVLAGLVEGFVTPETLPLPWALAVGFGVALPYWALVVWRGVLAPKRV